MHQRPRGDMRYVNGVMHANGVFHGEMCIAVEYSSYLHGRNAAQNGFHPTRKSSTDWFKVPPAVPFSTGISEGMKPALGHDSSVDVV